MRRDEFEHVIRAAGEVTGEKELLVVGSQSILGSFPGGLPKGVTLSAEVDIASFDDPDDTKANTISGNIGELSEFHQTFGYYAEGVGQTTSTLPDGWRNRLVTVTTENMRGVVAKCLDPHDLCVAKLLAGRAKDKKFVRELLVSGHVKPKVILERLAVTPALYAGQHVEIASWIRKVCPPGRNPSYRRALRAIEEGKAQTDGARGEATEDRSIG